MELFNIKMTLDKMDKRVLFNGKTKKYEIYKEKDLERLRKMKNGES